MWNNTYIPKSPQISLEYNRKVTTKCMSPHPVSNKELKIR